MFLLYPQVVMFLLHPLVVMFFLHPLVVCSSCTLWWFVLPAPSGSYVPPDHLVVMILLYCLHFLISPLILLYSCHGHGLSQLFHLGLSPMLPSQVCHTLLQKHLRLLWCALKQIPLQSAVAVGMPSPCCVTTFGVLAAHQP